MSGKFFMSIIFLNKLFNGEQYFRRHFSMTFFMNLAEFVMALMGNDTSERQVFKTIKLIFFLQYKTKL